MAQLAKRVRIIEQIKYEKERHKRFDKSRKEIALVKVQWGTDEGDST